MKYPLIKLLIICLALALLNGCAPQAQASNNPEGQPNSGVTPHASLTEAKGSDDIKALNNKIDQLTALIESIQSSQITSRAAVTAYNMCNEECSKLPHFDYKTEESFDESAIGACFKKCRELEPLDQPRSGC